MTTHLRLPVCRNRHADNGNDIDRQGTVCQGCIHRLEEGCPNVRAWSLHATEGVVSACEAAKLVHCQHYDCGCDRCAIMTRRNNLRGARLTISPPLRVRS